MLKYNDKNIPNFAEHGLPESPQDLRIQHAIQKMLGCRYEEWVQIKHLYTDFIEDARAAIAFNRETSTRELDSPRTEIGPDMHVEWDAPVYRANDDVKAKIINTLRLKQQK